MNAPVDYALVRQIQQQVARALTTEKQARVQRSERELTSSDERQLAMALSQQLVQQHMTDLLSSGQILPDAAVDRHLVEAVDAAMYGAGELQELLDNDLVENIDINGADEVWVTYADGRGKQRGRAIAATDEDLVEIVRTLASHAGLNPRPFNPANPELDLRLGDGSRLSAVMSASERPVVSIRRNRFSQMHMPMLVQLGSMDIQTANFLTAAVRARANIVVAGATDAGKTTVLRALINCIDPMERLVTIESSLELGLRRQPSLHPDVVEWEVVLPDNEGRGGVTVAALVRRSRRHNPSRVIVGEVLGPEVVEMLSAMAQGNDGSLSTLHARDASEVFQRLATEAAKAEKLDFAVTYKLIASAVDFVVFVRKVPKLGNRRCVVEILEVTGTSGDEVERSPLFSPGADGRAARNADISIRRVDMLAGAGYTDSGAWGHQLGQHWTSDQ